MTIIVLLILAAVAINLTIGNNGIFTRAQDAVDLYTNKAKEEEEMMNNIDDIFNSKWTYTYAGLNYILSVNDLNEIYCWSGNTVSLNKNAEIIGNNIAYIQEDNKYYEIYEWKELPYKKVVCNSNNYNAKYELLIMDNNNKIIIMDDKGNYQNLEVVFPEVKDMTFVDISSKGIIEADNGKQYIITNYDDNKKEITCLQDELSLLNSEKIIDMSDFVPIFIKDDGKVIVKFNNDVTEISFEEPIVNIDGTIFKGKSENYYTVMPNEDNSVKSVLLSEMFPVLKEEKIIKIKSNCIFTESGKCYIPDNEGNLVNLVDEYTELKNENIVDVVSYIESERVNIKTCILTESGKLYEYNSENNDFESVIDNVKITSAKGGFNGVIINTNDFSAIFKLNNQKLEVWNVIMKKERKLPFKLPEKISNLVDPWILTENGNLYELHDDYSISKVDLSNFEGNKIIYVSKNYFIDEEHNVYEMEYDGIKKIMGTEEGIITQIEDSLLLTEEGKVICRDGISIEENSKNILENKKIIKITDRGYLIDDEGKVYFTEYISQGKIGIIEDSTSLGIENIKIKDINGLSMLDEEGKVYSVNAKYSEELNKEEFSIKCLSDDSSLPIYGKTIIRISDARSFSGDWSDNYQSYLDNEGNKYSFGNRAEAV